MVSIFPFLKKKKKKDLLHFVSCVISLQSNSLLDRVSINSCPLNPIKTGFIHQWPFAAFLTSCPPGAPWPLYGWLPIFETPSFYFYALDARGFFPEFSGTPSLLATCDFSPRTYTRTPLTLFSYPCQLLVSPWLQLSALGRDL